MAAECDVAVIGGGVAGLATALTSAKLGLRTRLYEKATKVGGGSSLAYGGLWCGCNHIAAALHDAARLGLQAKADAPPAAGF